MGLFDIFKRKKATQQINNAGTSKDDIFKSIFGEMSKQPPSKSFVSGTVFDYARLYRNIFAPAVSDNDIRLLHSFFIKGYDMYLNDPSSVGGIPMMVNKENNDTNPMMWNLSVKKLENGDNVFLCYMPVQNEIHSARIFSIILGANGDGYYYCMLDKDETQESDVIRNKAREGVETVGAVSGRGFELMNSFVDCITKNYYA